MVIFRIVLDAVKLSSEKFAYFMLHPTVFESTYTMISLDIFDVLNCPVQTMILHFCLHTFQ